MTTTIQERLAIVQELLAKARASGQGIARAPRRAAGPGLEPGDAAARKPAPCAPRPDRTKPRPAPPPSP